MKKYTWIVIFVVVFLASGCQVKPVATPMVVKETVVVEKIFEKTVVVKETVFAPTWCGISIDNSLEKFIKPGVTTVFRDQSRNWPADFSLNVTCIFKESEEKVFLLGASLEGRGDIGGELEEFSASMRVGVPARWSKEEALGFLKCLFADRVWVEGEGRGWVLPEDGQLLCAYWAGQTLVEKTPTPYPTQTPWVVTATPPAPSVTVTSVPSRAELEVLPEPKTITVTIEGLDGADLEKNDCRLVFFDKSGRVVERQRAASLRTKVGFFVEPVKLAFRGTADQFPWTKKNLYFKGELVDAENLDIRGMNEVILVFVAKEQSKAVPCNRLTRTPPCNGPTQVPVVTKIVITVTPEPTGTPCRAPACTPSQIPD